MFREILRFTVLWRSGTCAGLVRVHGRFRTWSNVYVHTGFLCFFMTKWTVALTRLLASSKAILVLGRVKCSTRGPCVTRCDTNKTVGGSNLNVINAKSRDDCVHKGRNA